MNRSREPREDSAQLAPDDAAFVSRLAEHYRAPEPTAAGRKTFRAALDERVRRRAAPWRALALGLAAAAAGIAALLFAQAPRFVPALPDAAQGTAQASNTSPEEALLALAVPIAAADDALPDDYEAIAGLLLDEV